MIYGDIISHQINGHGSVEMTQEVKMEFMEHKELDQFQIFLEVAVIQFHGLILQIIYGYLEEMDMIQLDHHKVFIFLILNCFAFRCYKQYSLNCTTLLYI